MGKQSEPLEDLHALVVFVRVVEARSFTRAARLLRTTTSAVSKRISELERRLGVKLLARTTRRVALTEAGAIFYERAARILAAIDDAQRAVSHLASAARGTLRLSAPVLFGERHVAPLLPAFLAANKEVRLEVSFSDRFVGLVEENFEVAIRIGPVRDPSLVAHKIGPVDGLVVGAPKYLAEHGTPKTPHELVGHECLRYGLMTAAQEWRFHGSEGDFSVPVTGRLVVDHGGAAREAAIAGFGLARLPSFIVDRALADGTLVSILDTWKTSPGMVQIVHPAGRMLPKVRAFVDFIVPRLREGCHAVSVAKA
jgi:DNA-binding transcriptional LysR family regulator